MENRYTKKWSTVVIALFMLGVVNAFGQINPNPGDNLVTIEGKKLYEHEYNQDGHDAAREGTDTVMVTSIMNYFVMPDESYNTAYFAQNDYQKTDLTKSQFVWTVTNGTITPQAPNTVTTPGTSPWVKVTWGNLTGAVDLKMVEKPQGFGAACDGVEVVIPVWVIKQPTIKFNHATFVDAGCFPDIADAEYNFPVSVDTQSSQVLVDYTVSKDGAAAGLPVTVSATGGTFNVKFTDYGKYVVTIVKITDRIARKCEVSGIIGADKAFTFSVLKQPKAGKAYHVPNNF